MKDLSFREKLWSIQGNVDEDVRFFLERLAKAADESEIDEMITILRESIPMELGKAQRDLEKLKEELE